MPLPLWKSALIGGSLGAGIGGLGLGYLGGAATGSADVGGVTGGIGALTGGALGSLGAMSTLGGVDRTVNMPSVYASGIGQNANIVNRGAVPTLSNKISSGFNKGLRTTGRGALATGKGLGKMGLAGVGILAGAAVLGGAFAYGALEEPIQSGALTRNLDITSGAASSYLLGNPGLISTVIAANVKNVQGMSNLAGEDYMRSMSRAAPPTGGPMSFSRQGTERGMKGGGGMNINGNLALSLNNLRRGR